MIKKRTKIIIISTAIFIVIIGAIYFRIRLVNHWNTDPEAICNRAGGFWDGVQGCDNFCDKSGKYCPKRIIFGCWCGLEKCWDGKACIEKNEKN